MGLAILFISHWVGDFLLQSREMGQKKSQDKGILLEHLYIITGVLIIPAILVFNNPILSIWFCIANALFHGIIDWYIWRFYKARIIRKYPMYHPEQVKEYKKLGTIIPEFKYWEREDFYSTIGLDQCLHYLTIWFLYKALSGII